jgi:2-amino-4-hydroxy-6-hydroxymethyldihydropteridine diphosphokinase
LRSHFGNIIISRFYKTEPVGMNSDQHFINFCAFIETSFEPAACKLVCVAIETQLGRDRTHPFSRTRDRPADIDLLTHLRVNGSRVELESIPSYLVLPAAEVVAILWPP